MGIIKKIKIPSGVRRDPYWKTLIEKKDGPMANPKKEENKKKCREKVKPETDI